MKHTFNVGDKVRVIKCKIDTRNGIVGIINRIHTDMYFVGNCAFYADEIELLRHSYYDNVWLDLEHRLKNVRI